MPNERVGKPRILVVAGARPNFMKIAPIMRALCASETLEGVLLHTGQHYDKAMSANFFEELAIPEPRYNLEIGGGSHAQQTGELLKRFEPVLDEVAPAAVLVVGDVNSTLACALVACKKAVPVIHVEAGLRSFDRTMPEEINRVLTDQISDLLFTTEALALENLLREGIDPQRVHFVGNVMIDTVLHNRARAVPARETLVNLGAADFGMDGFAVLTLHRPSNVDDAKTLRILLSAMTKIAERLPIVFPVHPRTRQSISAARLDDLLDGRRLLAVPPQAYLSMLGLVAESRLVITDSGGLQEETTALGIPCLTLRENTERIVTVTQGTNTLIGTAPEKLFNSFDDFMKTGGKVGLIPDMWDGKAAGRIVAVLEAEIPAIVCRGAKDDFHHYPRSC